MSTFSKEKLSGSTDGKGVLVAATSIASGTTIHTAQSGSSLDLITLFCTNTSASPIELTIGWGGTTDPDHIIVQTIAAKSGLSLIVADLPLTNSLIVKAAAATGNEIVIYGYVNRIS